MADQLEYLQRLAYEAYDRGFMERAHNLALHTFSGFVKMYWPEIEKSCAWAKQSAAAPSLPSCEPATVTDHKYVSPVCDEKGCQYLFLKELRERGERHIAGWSINSASKPHIDTMRNLMEAIFGETGAALSSDKVSKEDASK